MLNGERSDLAALPPQDPRGKRLRRWIPGVVLLGGLVLVGLVIRFVWDEAPALPPKTPVQSRGNDMRQNGRPQVFGELAAASQRVDTPAAVPAPPPNDPQLSEALKRINVLEQILRDSQAKPPDVKPVEVKSTPQTKPNPQANAEARRRTEAQAKEAKDAARKQREEDAAARRGRLIWERKSDTSAVGAVKTVSEYSLTPGWLLPCVLKTAISNRAPGPFTAIVRSNVYDSATGQYLIIPSGATLIGTTQGGQVFGDTALQATVNKMVVGRSIYQMGQSGLQDVTGRNGLKDQVDQHWGRAIFSVLLTSALRGSTVATRAMSGNVGEQIGSEMARDTASMTNQRVQQFVNLSPTIDVRQGYPCNMVLNESLSIPKPFNAVETQRTAYRAQHGW